ncbi:MAG: cytochrome PufQ [Paracoccaceae bacterium]
MSVQMTNSGSHAEPQTHGHRAPRAEFYAYFTMIFLAALPFACLAWVARLVTTGKVPAKNPVSRAWADAGAITPSIFRA